MAHTFWARCPRRIATHSRITLFGCANCRRRVDELAELPALLALAPVSAFAADLIDHDPVVPLLAAARSRRIRRRWLAAAAATVAAACLVLLTAVIARSAAGRNS